MIYILYICKIPIQEKHRKTVNEIMPPQMQHRYLEETWENKIGEDR